MTTGDALDVQREARALGDPTRYRLFRYIADAEGPVSVAELTTYVGLNHNAIRQHLAVLKNAGFSDAVHVGGGVLAWVNQVDPSLPTY